MMNKKEAQALINAYAGNQGSEPHKVIAVFPHQVIPNLYGVVAKGWAYIIWDGEVQDAPDTWYEGDKSKYNFLECTLSEDCTWTYGEECASEDEDEDFCFRRAAGESHFKPGDTVYPVIFYASNNAGWLVCDATGKVKEDWCC
jgi:hypothetical protein